ncbi:MAG: peptidoglycan editing factor PgeF [Candidatus Aminicenantes bacterium]|nr:peptidoglycan editing factor PgeF [Candidatus Aminicenantes bacterium]
MKNSSLEHKEWHKSGSLLLASRLERIKHVIHGFGTKNWGKNDLDADPALKGFRVVFLRQIHSDRIYIISEEDLLDQEKIMAGDASVTEESGILLAIKTADCLPVLLTDEIRPVVAAVHCGWRGTAKRILNKTVAVMKKSFGCSSESLVAAFGPSISFDCYEVGEDVIRIFRTNGLPDLSFKPCRKKQGKYFLDLKEANRCQLADAGIAPENITMIDLCTHCESDLYSYRAEKEKAGRNFSFIGLKF